LNKLESVIYKLKLLKTIKIYLIFYIMLFESVFKNIKLKSIEIDEKIKKLLYEVKQIKSYQIINRELYYLIYWKGYK
jgi:hypothetical protein